MSTMDSDTKCLQFFFSSRCLSTLYYCEVFPMNVFYKNLIMKKLNDNPKQQLIPVNSVSSSNAVFAVFSAAITGSPQVWRYATYLTPTTTRPIILVICH